MKPLQPTDLPLDPSRAEDLLEALKGAFPAHEIDAVQRQVLVRDTFDWRLYKDRSTLTLTTTGVRSGAVYLPSGPAELVWCDLDGGERWGRLLDDPALPDFAEDFLDPAMAKTMARLLEMRRLLPLVRLELEGQCLYLQNKEEKTVVRVRLETPSVTPLSRPDGAPWAASPAPIEMPGRLRIEPIRGYPRQEKKVLRLLTEHLGLKPSARSLFQEAMQAAGFEPGGYSSKIVVQLHPELASATAMRKLCRTLFSTLRLNREGTRLDLDSEFLHDFRVAVRRTRSALSQVKRVFPPPQEEHFRRELKWLGSITGPTRDLDVFLLELPGYRARLPEDDRRHLEPLRSFLEARQEEEQSRLARALESRRYLDFEQAWDRFLEPVPPNELEQGKLEPEEAPNATRPIGDLASERIWKMYRRVMRDGRRIDEATPDQSLHDLRIECKKLRYLMELFRGLYPRDQIEVSIKELKRLQENLGSFNDYAVQREKLAQFADQMMAEDETPAGTFLAMGRLMHILVEQQTQERHRFAQYFGRFSRSENRQHFRSLFRPSKSSTAP